MLFESGAIYLMELLHAIYDDCYSELQGYLVKYATRSQDDFTFFKTYNMGYGRMPWVLVGTKTVASKGNYSH